MSTPRALAGVLPLVALALWASPTVGWAGEEGTDLRAVIGEVDGQPLAADPRLDAAAAALAADVLRERVLLAEEGRAFTAARRHLWDQGVTDPDLAHGAVLFDGAAPADAALAAALGPVRGYTHLGVGEATGADGGCRVVLVTRRLLEIVEPAPWAPAVEQPLRIRGDGVTGEPTAWVLAPDAIAHAIFLRREGEDWIGTLPASPAQGLHRLEILTDGAGGPALCAIGLAPGGGAAGGAPTAAGAREAEDRLWALLAMERARLGLGALRVHPALAEVARAHSLGLRDGADFGHGAPDSPAARVAATGLPHSRALENVARAAALVLAHTLIMASPGHRANLLDPGITHGGIGVAVSEPLAWYVTQEFVRLLPPLDLARERERAREVLAAHRTGRGNTPLRGKRALDRVAQRWADELGAQGARALTETQIRALTDEARFHLDDAERVVAELAWIEGANELAVLPLFDAPGLDQYGLGLYQAPEGGMLAVVVVLVDRIIPVEDAP